MKNILVFALFSVCSITYSQSNTITGIVINKTIVNNTRMGDNYGEKILIFLDTNNDKIIDAILILNNFIDGFVEINESIYDIIINEYIKIGGKIIFDSSTSRTNIRIIYSQNIISIDGRTKSQLLL